MKICEFFQAGAVAALLVACGSPAAREEVATPSSKSVFLYCPGATPSYLIAEAPRSGCRALVAGADYADGRVLVGVRGGTPEDDLQHALAAYQATVIDSMAAQRLLQVPDGTVPEAVVGLAGYPFITFASPDLLQHPAQSVT